jgi:hypothetical protein
MGMDWRVSKAWRFGCIFTTEAASNPSAFAYDSSRLLLAGTVIRRQYPARDIAGWDDPFREARPWIVPVESEAAAPFAWIAGIESVVYKCVSLTPTVHKTDIQATNTILTRRGPVI